MYTLVLASIYFVKLDSQSVFHSKFEKHSQVLWIQMDILGYDKIIY